ncbi:MAG: hypothetical protein HY295_00180 [Thaumarchaeota archaeon]|nr:hypothetical protein [Nitrososphaerota archaeon]
MDYKKEQIKSKVLKCINLLLKQDLFLLKNDAQERSITHKFAEYLQQEFSDWHVDCEYNRNLGKIKRRENGSGFNPDIIIHIRETYNDFLIIEVKKSNGQNNDEVNRLKEATENNSRLHYKLGLFILFYVEQNYQKHPELRWFENGQEIEL